jgi:hypothetical protein
MITAKKTLCPGYFSREDLKILRWILPRPRMPAAHSVARRLRLFTDPVNGFSETTLLALK